MGVFKVWFESIDSKRISSVEEAKRLSNSTGLSTIGIEFNIIEDAFNKKLPVNYENVFPLGILGNLPAGNMDKLLQMMGAFAQKMGVDAPDSLEQARSLKVRGPDFRRMTPPIIVQKSKGRMVVADGISRVAAAKLLRVGEIRAFVIG